MEEWAQMEANGAVFLPSAGHRDGTSFVDMGTCGRYNSSSPSEGQSSRFFMNWGSGYHGQTYSWRYLGFSVRLVLDAE